MRSMPWKPVLVAMIVCVAQPRASLAVDRMVGLVPSDGVGRFVKEFSVGAGTTIAGAQFANNDAATVFPSVVLIRGPLGDLSEGPTVASAANVQETSLGVVTVSWSTPVFVTEAETYLVAVQIPAGPGKQGVGRGPALGASDVASPNGSYIASGAAGTLCPLRADLGISLVTRGTAGGGAAKASGMPPDEPGTGGRTFLSSRTGSGGVTLSFGLAKPGTAVLRIYDVAGRAVRELAREGLQAGTHERTWDGTDERGTEVAKGIYFAQLNVSAQTLEHKILKAW